MDSFSNNTNNVINTTNMSSLNTPEAVIVAWPYWKIINKSSFSKLTENQKNERIQLTTKLASLGTNNI